MQAGKACSDPETEEFGPEGISPDLGISRLDWASTRSSEMAVSVTLASQMESATAEHFVMLTMQHRAST